MNPVFRVIAFGTARTFEFSGWTQMAKLKERLENHIVVAVMGFSLSVGVAVYSVASYFHAQEVKQLSSKFELAAAEQSARLASIERDMPDQKFLDIRKLLVATNDVSQIPTGAEFFAEDQFYAPTQDQYWHYQRTTEDGLVRLLSGESLSNELSELGQVVPVHLWQSSEQFHLESGRTESRWFPFIFVQRLPYKDIPKLLNLGVAAQSYESQTFETTTETPVNSQRFIDSIAALIRDDFTGVMFHLQNMISIQQALAAPNQRFRQLKVQKIGNVLYSQSVTDFLNVSVNGQRVDTFYLRQELILVSTRNDLYVVKITVPSLEPLPRGKAYSEINSWLASFRVVIDIH